MKLSLQQYFKIWFKILSTFLSCWLNSVLHSQDRLFCQGDCWLCNWGCTECLIVEISRILKNWHYCLARTKLQAKQWLERWYIAAVCWKWKTSPVLHQPCKWEWIMGKHCRYHAYFWLSCNPIEFLVNYKHLFVWTYSSLSGLNRVFDSGKKPSTCKILVQEWETAFFEDYCSNLLP